MGWERRLVISRNSIKLEENRHVEDVQSRSWYSNIECNKNHCTGKFQDWEDLLEPRGPGMANSFHRSPTPADWQWLPGVLCWEF